ncbi:MAG TPA: DUF2934 domain-containing protein [Methylophilaceae bacterium]|nr:DUF2934 domain-containing protein [Methylophilaceae bacterium]HQR61295.1 DUF2934 domain-containing protein [Methylophilaceae bacterium]
MAEAKTKPAAQKAAPAAKPAAAKKSSVAAPKTAAAKKPAAPKKAAAPKAAAAKKPAAAKKVVAARGAEERYRMVEVAAYYIAERNGFAGDPTVFWTEAEAQITKLLSK